MQRERDDYRAYAPTEPAAKPMRELESVREH
jgi:hypothetical protein